MTRDDGTATVNIRPGVSVLSLFRHLNYKAWYAMAEFVDNALQSFLDKRKRLEKVEGRKFRLRVEIEIEAGPQGRIVVRDNAAGIAADEYARAFKPAEPPPDRSGLAEFGIGMKSAACWFASKWSVRSKALGETVERELTIDVEDVVKHSRETLQPREKSAPSEAHYTEILLLRLHNPIHGKTQGKIKEHLTSIYRTFIREGLLALRFNGEELAHEEPAILVAKPYRSDKREPLLWRKNLSFRIGHDIQVHGFAAIREKASTSNAGFALFRRGRLIEGSADEGYRPEVIFGASNTYVYQRVFGELHIDGIPVSHTKDGFRWGEHEEQFLAKLKEALDSEPLKLLDQAQGHRVRPRAPEIEPGARTAVQSTARVVEREVPSVIEPHLQTVPKQIEPPAELPATRLAAKRQVTLDFQGSQWEIDIELSMDASIGDWLSISDQGSRSGGRTGKRRLSLRLSLAHPFMERFGGTNSYQIEPILRIAVALALAEVAAREAGVSKAGSIRYTVNDLLRNALSKP